MPLDYCYWKDGAVLNSRILVTTLLAIFVALLGIGIVVPIIPIYATDLGATGVTLGLMAAGFDVSRGVLQPFVGGMSDRRGRKRFLVAGLIVYAVSGFTYVFAPSVGYLILIRTIHGIGSAMIVPIAMAIMGDLAPPGKEGRYMAMFNIAMMTGIGGGPVIGGVFRDTLGMDAAFYSMSGLSALSLILVLTLLPPRPAGQGTGPAQSLLTTVRLMLHNRRVVGLLLARMLTVTIIPPAMMFLPILMDDFMDATGMQIGLVIGARTIVIAALQLPVGRLVDRYSKVKFLLLGSAIAAAALFVVPSADSFTSMIGLFCVLGTGEALIGPALAALATEEGRRYGLGSMMGVFNTVMSVGLLIGSMGSGLFMDSLGIGYAFFFVGVLVAVGTVISAPLIATKRDEPAA